MRRFLFVAEVFALLIGFYVMCVAIVAGLVMLTVFAAQVSDGHSARLVVFLFMVTCVGIFVVIRGVFVSTRVRAKHIVGLPVSAAEQPVLWERIQQLAQRVGTRAPRRLYLVPDVNAAVWENTRLLGLIPGKRQIMVGVPLLMALSVPQLDAVLAHELGHYSNRDTRIGGLVGRTRQSVLSALRAAQPRKVRLPGSDLFVTLFRAYAMLVLRVTQEASRAQEYAADRVAAEIAGPANTIAALSELRGIDAAFSFYLDRYLGAGLQLGLVPPPPEVFGGFQALLADPARRAEIDELRGKPPKSPPDRFDSHPPMAERIAALSALPQRGVADPPTDARAVVLLTDPAGTLGRVATRVLGKELAGKQVAPWDAVAQGVGLRRVNEQARPLADVVRLVSGRAADLPTFVDLVRAGRLTEILDALPRNEASRRTNATGRVAREHAKTVLAAALTGWLIGHLVATGRARWTQSWAQVGGELQMDPALRAELDSAVADLVALRPDGARLHAFVAGAGVAA